MGNRGMLGFPGSNPPGVAGANYADYYIYKDGSGYHTLRTWDNAVLFSHATDFASVVNRLLASLILVNSTARPNLWSPTNLAAFKEGLRVVSTAPEAFIAQTLIIPPSQDFILEMELTVIDNTPFASGADLIRIDSCMNCRFHFGVISSHSSSDVIVRVKPQTVGPDDQTTVTTSHLSIAALVADHGADGLILDSDLASITSLDVLIDEVNLTGTGNKVGVKFVDDAVNICSNNSIRILRINANTTTVSLPGTNHKNQYNRIRIIGADSQASIVTSDTSAASDYNAIFTHALVFPLVGGQIKFPATQNASTDANTLDDYEEGTYNPTVTPGSGAITSYTAVGYYVKIGKHVTFHFKVTLTNVGTAAGAMHVSLPFTSANIGFDGSGIGRENAVVGTGLLAFNINNSTTSDWAKADGNSPFTSGYVWTATLTYVAAA